MGLKYEVFMIKGTEDDLHKSMTESLEGKITDVSDLMKREREYITRPLVKTDDIEKFKNDLDREPDLDTYMKDHCKGFYIWWMNHPKAEGYVVGGYTSYWILNDRCMSIFLSVLLKAGVHEYLQQSYYHSNNDGDISKVYMQKDPVAVTIEAYEHNEDEKERYQKYLRRVNKLCGYPVKSWHDWISGPKIHIIPWTYEIQLTKKVSGKE